MNDYYHYLRKVAENRLTDHFKMTGEKITQLFSQGSLNKFLYYQEHSVLPSDKIHTIQKKEPNISFQWTNDKKTQVQIRGLQKPGSLFVTSKSIWHFLSGINSGNPSKKTILVTVHLFNALSQTEFAVLSEEERARLINKGFQKSDLQVSRKHWRFWVAAAEKVPELGRRIEIYQNAVIELPNDVQIVKNLAVALDEAGRMKEAEEWFLKGLKIAPSDADINSNYGLFLHRTKQDYDKAEEYFCKAHDLSPRHKSNNAHYAWFLHQVRLNYDKAEEQYKIALEINPHNIYALNNYACLLCFVKFQADKGISLFEKAIEVDPEDAWVLGNLALALTTYDRDKRLAEVNFQKAIALDPVNPLKHANFAQLLFVLDKEAEAMEHIEIAKNYAGSNLEILLEIEFYLYMHCYEMIDKARRNIIALLDKGVTSEKKNFSVNIKTAINRNHPEVDSILSFARRISEMNYNSSGKMLIK